MSFDSNLSLDFLRKDNKNLEENGKDGTPEIVAPKEYEDVSINQNDDGTWSKSSVEKDSQVKKDNQARSDESKQYSDEVSALENLAKISDNKIISIATQINAKKQLIFDKIQEAVSAGCSVGLSTFGSTPVVEVNGVDITLGVGLTITDDFPFIKKYGGLDDFNANVPFSSDDTITLTSSNSGKGYFSGFTENGGGDVGTFKTVFYDPDNTEVIPDPTSICAARTAEIEALANEINTLRSQIDNTLISNTNDVKDRKTTSEVFVWGYGSRENKIQDQIDINTSVINTIEGQSGYQ
jgi:hypothetical protein|tara:strand:- start:62 stop:946 length:885 start_codon:yes stop_codon:yes gene_type:complete